MSGFPGDSVGLSAGGSGFHGDSVGLGLLGDLVSTGTGWDSRCEAGM